MVGDVGGLGNQVGLGKLAVLGVGAIQGTGLEAPNAVTAAEELLAARAGFAAAAAYAGVDHHVISGLYAPHLAPDLYHLSRGVGTRDVRHDYLHARKASACPDVVVIAACCPDLEEHLVGPELRFGDFLVLKLVDFTVLFEHYCLHGLLRVVFR